MKRSEVSELGEQVHRGAGESNAGEPGRLRSEGKSHWEFAIVKRDRRSYRYSDYRQVWQTTVMAAYFVKFLKTHPDAILCVREHGDKRHGHRVEDLDDLRPGGRYHHYVYFNRKAKRRRSGARRP